ncbi:MAG: hypothetical protein ABIP51_21345 [Bacteroidia bacterium]
MMRNILLLVLIFISKLIVCQSFVNGNFENNTANGADQINLSNESLNAMLPGVHSFGSYGDVDIIRSTTYGGSGAQNKEWYIGITGGGTDIVALSLNQSLIAGKKYTLSFYDRKHGAHPSNPIQIGLSTLNSSFGSTVYTSPEAPVLNTWTQRTFTFIAPNSGQFITVQMPEGNINEWANIDNFSFGESKCTDVLTLQASKNIIEKGESVTLTANGATTYTWGSISVLNSLNERIVNDQPFSTTVYTVKSQQEGCTMLTATVEVKVNIPFKKDTVVVINDKVIDSIETKTYHIKYNRHRLKGRKLDIQETVEVTDPTVKLLVWDKNRIDGDIVSIYLNGQLIEENLVVSKEKKEIIIKLQAGSNMVVMHAINLGRIPPNTAALSLNNNKHKLITLVSDLKKSGTLEIIYNPEAISVR